MCAVWSGNNFYYDEKIRGISSGINYDTIVLSGQVIGGTSGYLGYLPIIPGSVVLTNGFQTYVDNGSGVLVSSLSPHGGTINYTTGAWTVTAWDGSPTRNKFANYMAATSPSLVNINWDALAFPTVKGIGRFTSLIDRSVIRE